jgi:ribosomal protein L37E
MTDKVKRKPSKVLHCPRCGRLFYELNGKCPECGWNPEEDRR